MKKFVSILAAGALSLSVAGCYTPADRAVGLEQVGLLPDVGQYGDRDDPLHQQPDGE